MISLTILDLWCRFLLFGLLVLVCLVLLLILLFDLDLGFVLVLGLILFWVCLVYFNSIVDDALCVFVPIIKLYFIDLVVVSLVYLLVF